MSKEDYQETMVDLRKLIKDLEGIGELTASGKEFTKLVKKVRDLAAMVVVIANELQRGAKSSP